MITSGLKPDHLLSLACQVEPRIGDEFIPFADVGNPFATCIVKVLAIKNGWVQYEMSHLPNRTYKQVSSCPLDTFGKAYEPTRETMEARKHAVSLPDYLAYVADQKQIAEDEAREVAQRDHDASEMQSESGHEREVKRYRINNPQD